MKNYAKMVSVQQTGMQYTMSVLTYMNLLPM